MPWLSRRYSQLPNDYGGAMDPEPVRMANKSCYACAALRVMR